ncbi:MAG: putative ABC transporter permease [Saccharofermentanales bacterium]
MEKAAHKFIRNRMLDKKILSMTLYELLWFFMIYAFIGWLMEEIVILVVYGVVVKRGFLYGPIGPIYGIGMLIVILSLTPIKKRIVPLFAGAVLLTSAFEYISGFLLDVIFNQKWWNYVESPFNLHGYISLGSSLAWGVVCVFIVRIIHPHIQEMVDSIDIRTGYRVLTAMYLIYLVDNIATFTRLILERM